MRSRALALAAAIVMAPLGAKAADLVVWWDEGWYAEEAEAAAEIVAAFETQTGKQVELTFHPEQQHAAAIAAALEAHEPPDFAFGINLAIFLGQWALDDRLVDLSDSLGSFADLFDPDALDRMTLRNRATGQRALYALPMGRSTNHVHVWASLLEQAGFTLDDIPREWRAFWAFWCEEVQPAVRRATGRDDIWGVGLPMSIAADDTWVQFFQFLAAYDADYVTRDGAALIGDPDARRKLVTVLEDYTASYRKGCTPPDAASWTNVDNNRQFHDRTIVMTANETLSIRARSEGSGQRTTSRTLPRSNGRSGPAASPFRSGATCFPP